MTSCACTGNCRRPPYTCSGVVTDLFEYGEFAHQHNRKILDFLDGIHPRAATKDDIAANTGLDAVAVARRMVEIEMSGRVERAGYGKLASGRPATLWRAKA